MNPMPIRVVLCDDEESSLAISEDIVLDTPDCELVESFGVVQDMKEYLEKNDNWDILVQDIIMRNNPIAGQQVLKWFTQKFPKKIIIMCSGEKNHIHSCFGLGANSFVLKTDWSQLEEAILNCVRTGSWYPEEVVKELQWQMRRLAELNDKGLTEQEVYILKLISFGISKSDIIEKLCISPTTFRSHISNIRKKYSGSTEILNMLKTI